MNTHSMTVEHDKRCFFKCISWSAVIVGALVGLGLSFLLNLFSLAIGLTAFTMTDTGIMTFAIEGYIGLAIVHCHFSKKFTFE